jgi:hypothetical protein
MASPGSPRPGPLGSPGAGGGLGNTSGGAPFASPSAASVVTAATGGTDSASTAGGGPKTKSALVVAAESLDRRQALLAGYLRKHNSQGRWQKRYFESACPRDLREGTQGRRGGIDGASASSSGAAK